MVGTEIAKLKDKVTDYKEGLKVTEMEGFDIEYEQACKVLDDFVLACEEGL